VSHPLARRRRASAFGAAVNFGGRPNVLPALLCPAAALGGASAGKSHDGKAVGNEASTAQLPSAKLQYSLFQRPDTREPQCRGSGMEPVILSDERRDTLAITVCLPGRPGKSWRGLDEDAEGQRVRADRDCGGQHIRRRVDHRHGVGCVVRDKDLPAVRGHRGLTDRAKIFAPV
jgi:hypothetical protein